MAKKYSVNVEDGEVVSVEVDGVTYANPEDVPDPADRARIYQILTLSDEDGFDSSFDREFAEFDEDFRELERQSARFPAVIAGIFALIAALMLVIALISGISAGRKVAREQQAPGRVVEMILRTSPGGEDSQGTYQAPQDYYYPVVEFSLPDGSLKTVQLGEGSWPPAYEVGEQVTVLYDPQKPINARIQSAAGNVLVWLLPGITGTLGLVFLVAAGFVLWFLKPAPQAEEPAEA